MKNRFIAHSTDATSLSFPAVHAALSHSLSLMRVWFDREKQLNFRRGKVSNVVSGARGEMAMEWILILNFRLSCSSAGRSSNHGDERTHIRCVGGRRVNVPVSYSVHFNERIQVLNALYALLWTQKSGDKLTRFLCPVEQIEDENSSSSCVNLREFSFNFLSAHRWNPEQISSSCWQMLARLEVALSSNSPLNHLDRIYQIFMLWFDDDDDDDTRKVGKRMFAVS